MINKKYSKSDSAESLFYYTRFINLLPHLLPKGYFWL